MKRTNWFDRKFSPIEDNGILPCIIERLEGTPARLAEKMAMNKRSMNSEINFRLEKSLDDEDKKNAETAE